VCSKLKYSFSPVTVESDYGITVTCGLVTTEQFLVLFETLSLDAYSSNDNAMQRTIAACKVQGKMLFIS